ncbi:hypothetical protein [Halomonas binhaiensis]|uniref:hypothetical protein n=1 Tax=Halomonas binhaiensis TaxID=2562282 RepID=UPI001F074857|nr:hypothetical protein [Halomonas binhaiensis]
MTTESPSSTLPEHAPPAAQVASSQPETPLPSLRHQLGGWLILTGLVLQIASFMLPWLPSPLVSLLLWSGAITLWPDIPRRNQWQAGILAGLGVLMLMAAKLVYGGDIDAWHVLDGNTFVVTMLVGVSFISLIGRPPQESQPKGPPITGKRGLIGTWLGVHLLGAILNLSTMFVIGDRLERRGPLNDPQLLALNRGLCSAAMWSPFFAAMGVVISLTPDIQFTTMVMVGLPVALAGGLFSIFELSRRFDLSTTPGFSLSPRSLLMPAGMAALVLLFHYLITPNLTIVAIITFLMPGIAILANLLRGSLVLRQRIQRHRHFRLPAMRGEITLFLCAGLLTKGMSSLVTAATQGNWTLFPVFDTSAAILSFLGIVASAIAGLHPIIGVSVLASMLDLGSINQNLFGFVALASWGVGTAVGPLSGTNLSLQGRYGISGYRMMRNNLLYALFMSLLVMVAITCLANSTG